MVPMGRERERERAGELKGQLVTPSLTVGLPVPAFFGGSLPKEEETAPLASHYGYGLAFAAAWRKVKDEKGMSPVIPHTRV